MKSYLVTYDLIDGGDYDSLFEEIKEIASGHWHCLESVWIINSNLTASQINTRLLKTLDSNDRILVTQIHGPNTSWSRTFSDECRDWLKKNLHPVES
ncbi:hypothetical protein [uncultured Aquimarina sp.]|uniref:hypothetical protein n=1 Tax=uncultured Aquimarina sp. TaxID=575652 RepID=UPI002627F877|nr:hypothetical protein [uncultured Aquimarina sp.]